MSEFHIGDAIRGFLHKSHLKNGIRAVQIEEIWEQLMGKTIARYTDKIKYRSLTRNYSSPPALAL
jgi:hypothetical protein